MFSRNVQPENNVTPFMYYTMYYSPFILLGIKTYDLIILEVFSSVTYQPHLSFVFYVVICKSINHPSHLYPPTHPAEYEQYK